MKKRILIWLLLVGFMAAGIFTFDSYLTQRALARKTIRLHVVANSDTQEDQEQKLRVRDAVLAAVSPLTAQCENSEEAQKKIEENMDTIKQAAQEALRAEGSDCSVTVQFGTEHFDTRYYETFTLPAGSYLALRVNIGAAQGHNWWCVVFPSLCLAATSDAVKECAELGGYDRAQTDFVTGGEETYTVRFKTLEWLEKLAAWFE